MDEYIVYLLVNNKDNSTYVGITNNPENRILQHNNKKSGGAKYTTNKVKNKNCNWIYYSFIPCLSKNEALSIEKKIHIYTKKTKGTTPLEKRINCIKNIITQYYEIELFIL
jgi:predicted GIY-YIG superfamily endonuclease